MMVTIIAASPVAADSPDARGRQLYVTNILSNDVSIFDIRAAGQLALRNPLVPSGGAPRTIVIAPDGRTAYVANGAKPVPNGPDFNAISVYRVQRDGGLTSLGRPVRANQDPDALAIAPDGKTLYAVNRGTDTVSTFAVASDGRLLAFRDIPSESHGNGRRELLIGARLHGHSSPLQRFIGSKGGASGYRPRVTEPGAHRGALSSLEPGR